MIKIDDKTPTSSTELFTNLYVATQQNYEFLDRKKFLLFLVLRNFFLETRNKVLTKSFSFLKSVRIILLRINVLKLRQKILTKNLTFLN